MADAVIPARFKDPLLGGAKDGRIELEEGRILLAGTLGHSTASPGTIGSTSAPYKLAIDLDDIRALGFFHSGWHRLAASMATPLVFRRTGVESHQDLGVGGSSTVFRGELMENLEGSSPRSVLFHLGAADVAALVEYLVASRQVPEPRKRSWLRSNRRRMWLCVAGAPVPVLGLVTVFTLFRGIAGLKALGRALGEGRSFTVARASTIAAAALGANVLGTAYAILLPLMAYLG